MIRTSKTRTAAAGDVMGKFMKQKRQILESPTLKFKSSLERILLMTNKYGDKKPFN